MRELGWRTAVVVALAAGLGAMVGGGCRAARAPAPRTVAPARPDPLQGWVGQARFLLHRGDQSRWTLKRQDLGSVAGQCDVAVEVRQARFDRGVASLTLETIGRPRLARRGAHQERCGDDQPQIVLEVSGFDAGATPSDLEAALSALLHTPEAYLQRHKLAFDLAAVSGPVAPAPDHQLARPPARLLWVDAITRDPGGKIHHEAEVGFQAVVGPDGRLREPRLDTALGEDHERRVLRVLPLWRFEPARKGAEPAAARVSERLVFRIY